MKTPSLLRLLFSTVWPSSISRTADSAGSPHALLPALSSPAPVAAGRLGRREPWPGQCPQERPLLSPSSRAGGKSWTLRCQLVCPARWRDSFALKQCKNGSGGVQTTTCDAQPMGRSHEAVLAFCWSTGSPETQPRDPGAAAFPHAKPSPKSGGAGARPCRGHRRAR